MLRHYGCRITCPSLAVAAVGARWKTTEIFQSDLKRVHLELRLVQSGGERSSDLLLMPEPLSPMLMFVVLFAVNKDSPVLQDSAHVPTVPVSSLHSERSPQFPWLDLLPSSSTLATELMRELWKQTHCPHCDL